MNKLKWYVLVAFSLSYSSNLLQGAGTHQPATVKISNKTGKMWIWVQVNDNKPRKIWRSRKFTLMTNTENSVYVYKKNPPNIAGRQNYKVILGGAGLRELKHGLQVRNDRLVYRYVGKEKVLEKKERIEIWPTSIEPERRAKGWGDTWIVPPF